MQHEIMNSQLLLDKNGHINEPGYTKGQLMDYDRKSIKAPAMRIKEWDYYLITNNSFALALTIDDNSYMGLDSFSILDFKTPCEHTKTVMSLLPNGKLGFPSSSLKGDLIHSGKKHWISFVNNGSFRILKFHADNFFSDSPIDGELKLSCPPTESMVIVTPFAENPQAFYYNQKINCMPASGIVTCCGKKYEFEPKNSFGLLDWGRGVWTYKNTWYWGSASGIVDGSTFGFNIGYGFGDTTAASENMIFYNQKCHKLDQVTFNIPIKDNGKGKPTEDYMKPWTFSSNDGRFEMNFVPILDRKSDTNIFLIRSNQHQVFGLFSGKAILDDGKVIKINNFLGFAEKVYNKW